LRNLLAPGLEAPTIYTELMLARILQRLLERCCTRELQDRTEGFLLSAAHFEFHVIEQRGCREEDFFIALQRKSATID
jgi:hypothetical protein